MTFSQRSSIRAAALVSALIVIFFAPFAAHGKKHPPAAPVDLNAATLEELQQLPGVGPSTAQAIVTFREKSGAFKRAEDLLAVHGISQAKFESIRPYVVVKALQQRKR